MISFSTIPIDPWVVPDKTNIDSFGNCMPPTPIELDYEAIHLGCATHSNILSSFNWVNQSLDYGMSSDPSLTSSPPMRASCRSRC